MFRLPAVGGKMAHACRAVSETLHIALQPA
jgi:hypothetical protein